MSEENTNQGKTRSEWLVHFENNPSDFWLAPDELKNDEDFVVEAVKANATVFKKLSKHRITSKLMVRLAGVETSLLAECLAGIRNNPDVIRAWCQESSVYFYDAGAKLKGDLGFVLELMEQEGNEPVDIIEAASSKVRRAFAKELDVDEDDVVDCSEEELWETARILRERMATT